MPVPKISTGVTASDEGRLRGSLPKVNSIALSRTMPPATVASSQASEPFSTKGRTSSRSTVTPRTAQPSSAPRIAAGIGQPRVTPRV